jgi:hypothetical protein
VDEEVFHVKHQPDMITVTFPRVLAVRMTGPWYVLKKQESDTVRSILNEALKGNQWEK